MTQYTFEILEYEKFWLRKCIRQCFANNNDDSR